MTETTHYNIYRIHLRHPSGINHQGIALVPVQQEGQTAGRFYHVTGNVGVGMVYERRPAFTFGQVPEFRGKELICTIEKSSLGKFEEIAKGVPPPKDERVLYEAKPEPPAGDCGTWVEEVLRRVQVEGLGVK